MSHGHICHISVVFENTVILFVYFCLFLCYFFIFKDDVIIGLHKQRRYCFQQLDRNKQFSIPKKYNSAPLFCCKQKKKEKMKTRQNDQYL